MKMEQEEVKFEHVLYIFKIMASAEEFSFEFNLLRIYLSQVWTSHTFTCLVTFKNLDQEDFQALSTSCFQLVFKCHWIFMFFM